MNQVSLRGSYAGFVSRAAALIVDILFISISIAVVNWLFTSLLAFASINLNNCSLTSQGWFGFRDNLCNVIDISLKIFSAAFPFVYFIFFWTLSGQTPGKILIGLRVVSNDGTRVRLPRALRRMVGYWLSILTLGWGFFRVLIDDRRRGLHDRFAGTLVVYDWDIRMEANYLERGYQKIQDLKAKAREMRRVNKPGKTGEAPAEEPAEEALAEQL